MTSLVFSKGWDNLHPQLHLFLFLKHTTLGPHLRMLMFFFIPRSCRDGAMHLKHLVLHLYMYSSPLIIKKKKAHNIAGFTQFSTYSNLAFIYWFIVLQYIFMEMGLSKILLKVDSDHCSRAACCCIKHNKNHACIWIWIWMYYISIILFFLT